MKIKERIKNEWENVKYFREVMKKYHKNSDIGTLLDLYMTWAIMSWIFVHILGVTI